MSFDELPPHRHPNPLIAAYIEPGTVRFHLPRKAKLPWGQVTVQLFKRNRLRVVPHDPDTDGVRGAAVVKKVCGHRVLDVQWLESDFDPDILLDLDCGRLLWYAGFAPQLNRKWMTVAIETLKKDHLSDTINMVKQVLQPHEALDFWTTDLESLKKGKPTRRFTGKLFVLVELKPQTNIEHPYDIAAKLPGFVEIAGTKYKLNYVGRRQHCRVCQSTDDFHTYAACKARQCTDCKDPEHALGPCTSTRRDRAYERFVRSLPQCHTSRTQRHAVDIAPSTTENA